MKALIKNTKLFLTTCFLCSALLGSLYSQSRITLSNNIIVNIKNGGIITINNSSDNAIAQTTNGGKIISEGEENAIQWCINNSVGSYIIPFASNSFVPIPLELTIANAGVTSSVASVYFSTYETLNDDNTNYPSDVTNMNSNCSNNNGLFAVDRFWRIDAQGYSTKPTPVINFGYSNAINEIAVTNTITESKLKAQRFNTNINNWETPQKIYGQANTSSQQVNNISVSPIDFYKTWTLIDTSILELPITVVNSATNVLCEGNTVTITANGASQYTLLPINSVNSTGAFVATPSVTTTYTVIGSIGTGTSMCLSSSNNSNAVSTISINPLPIVSTSVTNVLCYGSNTGAVIATITSSLPVTYTWSNGSHATAINGLIAGTYMVVVTDNLGCIKTYSSSVSQPTSAIQLAFNTQNPKCYLDTNGLITVTPSGGTANYTYSWQPVINNSNVLSSIGAGNYTLFVADANGCITFSVVSLTQALSAMQSMITNSMEPNCNESDGNITINTSGGVSPYQFHWLNNNGQSTTPNSNASFNFLSEGQYTLVITDSYGCVDSLTTLLTCVSPISIPQLFTPNADGKNDVFEIKGIERYPNNVLEIYNRWGNLVYQKTNYQNNWNGKYNANKELLPASTYFVVLQLGDTNNKTLTGYLELRY